MSKATQQTIDKFRKEDEKAILILLDLGLRFYGLEVRMEAQKIVREYYHRLR